MCEQWRDAEGGGSPLGRMRAAVDEGGGIADTSGSQLGGTLAEPSAASSV